MEALLADFIKNLPYAGVFLVMLYFVVRYAVRLMERNYTDTKLREEKRDVELREREKISVEQTRQLTEVVINNTIALQKHSTAMDANTVVTNNLIRKINDFLRKNGHNTDT